MKLRKKITALTLILSLTLSITAFANNWAEIQYTGYEPLNMWENELFEITGEITAEEYDGITDGEGYPDYRDAKYDYNDGLRVDFYDYEYMEGHTMPVSALYDINGNKIFDYPEAETSAMPYVYMYNLGYLLEREPLFNDTEIPSALITFTNMMTGVRYFFDSFDCNPIKNDATFEIACNGKYYNAKLKKNAIVTVFLDGEKLYFDQLPIIENGRTLVPLRTIFEELGATVGWNGETNTVTATKGDTEISLTINNTNATKNGETVALDVPAKLVGGRTLVPVRFVSDCFGIGVDWDDAMQKVILTSK